MCQGATKKRAAIRQPVSLIDLACQRQLAGMQDTQSPCLGDRTRPVVGTEFTGKHLLAL
jgi:hypothetical protein